MRRELDILLRGLNVLRKVLRKIHETNKSKFEYAPSGGEAKPRYKRNLSKEEGQLCNIGRERADGSGNVFLHFVGAHMT